LKLFHTDEEFVVHGHPYPGVPFLVDNDMALVKVANDYLRHVAVVRGRAASKRTWTTYGNHLYEYFSFLEANDVEWDSVNQTHFAAWRDSMLNRGNKRNTVNQRLGAVTAFYQWALNEGMTHSMPFNKESVWVAKPKGFLAHVDASGGRFEANELTLKTHKPVPKFLHTEQAKQFVAALTPRRNRLMAYLMWLTGMRREEVVSLNLNVLPNPSGHPVDRALKMNLDSTITPTKGDKTRWVMLPYDLAVQLFDYLDYERPALEKKFKSKYKVGTDLLFLTQYGEPISLEGLNNSFSKASKKSGIKCTPHMLRHTFATYELVRMTEHKGDNGALYWVKERLGHSSITTTEVYIHAADLISHDEIDGYQAEVCAFLRGDG